MKRTLLALTFCLAACAAAPVSNAPVSIAPPATPSPWAKANPAWVARVAPFRIIGPIYYVGTEDLGIYLIKSSRGLILLDGGLPDTAPLVAQSVAELGFNLRDVKFLLNSHAHFDHSGGLAALKAASGASLVSSEGDRSALEGGFYLGSEEEHRFDAPPVKVDRTIADGEQLSLGDVTMTAHITPGHTRGCTSWTMRVREGGKDHDVLFFCSASIAANRLVAPPQYPGIVGDYRQTFAKTADWHPDVLLAAHASFFDLQDKRRRQLAGDPLAFVRPGEFEKLRAMFVDQFDKALAEQQLKAGQTK